MDSNNLQPSENIKDQLKTPEENILPQKIVDVTLKQEKANFFPYGVLGFLFGADTNRATINMAFWVFTLAILAGVIYMFRCHSREIERVNEFWSIIMPIITMSLGFIFGKKMN